MSNMMTIDSTGGKGGRPMAFSTKFEFETFVSGPRRAGCSPRVTLAKTGNLNFNRAFKDAYGKDLESRHIIFRYDSKNEVIGLRIVLERTPHSRPIRVLQGGKGLTVSARAFLKHFGIPYEGGSRSYPIEPYKPDDEAQAIAFFIISLRENA
jgi:hypothetical protein